MRWHSFSEVVTDVTSKFYKIKASDYKAQGQYKIIDQGKNLVAGYTDDSTLTNDQLLPIVIFGDHTRSLKYVEEPIALGADGAKALWINDELAIARYVYYYLRSVEIQGAGYSRHFKFLKEIKIPIPFKEGAPNFNDQARIVHLLARIEGLIAQRERHLQQIDELLKSTFLEMFGDPIRNEKGWEPLTAKDYADLVTVGVVVKPASHYAPTGVVALRSLNVKPGKIDLGEIVHFSREAHDGPLAKSRLSAGDVVVVRTGKTGIAAVIPDELDGANCIDLIIVRPKLKRMNPHYLACLLNSERGATLVAAREVGGIQKHFNVGALNSIAFPMPPREIQDEFARVVGHIETIKINYQQSLIDLKTLFDAVTQKAFKGDLDLSQVPLPESEPKAVPRDATPPGSAEESTADRLFSLPELPITLSLAHEARRKDALRFWFDAYLDALLPGDEFLARKLLDAINFRLIVMDDEDLEFDSDDHDTLKAWVFEALESGRLSQSYDGQRNQVSLRRPPASSTT